MSHYNLMDCTNTLLREIAMPEQKRIDIAKTYALAMRAEVEGGEAVDWMAVNAAIIKRWSTSGLVWIKTQAGTGKCWKDKPEL